MSFTDNRLRTRNSPSHFPTWFPSDLIGFFIFAKYSTQLLSSIKTKSRTVNVGVQPLLLYFASNSRKYQTYF